MTSSDMLRQLGSTVTEAGKEGLEKAKELRDSARITLEIRNREFSIQKAYRELGRAYYRDHKNDEDPEYDQVAYVRAIFEEIGELKAAKDELRGIKRCPNCGDPIQDGANFCPNCGRSYDDVEEEAEEEAEAEAEEIAEEIAEALREAEKQAEAEDAEEILEDIEDALKETGE